MFRIVEDRSGLFGVLQGCLELIRVVQESVVGMEAPGAREERRRRKFSNLDRTLNELERRYSECVVCLRDRTLGEDSDVPRREW